MNFYSPPSPLPASPSSWPEASELLSLLDHAQEGLLLLEETGRVLQLTAPARVLLGMKETEPVARLLLDYLHPDHEAAWVAQLRGWSAGEESTQSWRLRSGEARERVVELRGRRLETGQLLVLGRELTADRMTERILQQTQKIETLGLLSGGIAHEFNNILTGIMGNASLARMILPADSELHAYLKQVENSSTRASQLCRQMLLFSGKSRVTMQRLDLSVLVEETSWLLQISIHKRSPLKFFLAKSLPAIAADATQLRQALMYLVINASEAQSDPKAAIEITTGIHTPDPQAPPNRQRGEPMDARPMVFLEVKDYGSGMEEAVLARIFEPFFTTKTTGRGLGLVTVLGNTRAWSGVVQVDSALGGGSRFRLVFPVALDGVGGAALF